MHFIKQRILRAVYKLLRYRPTDMPMVQYWKTKSTVQAKVITNEDGALVMKMEGEDHIFPGYPRGFLLFGKLSKLKHRIKTELYNDSWWALEDGRDRQEVIRQFRQRLWAIKEQFDELKYDLLPPSKMIRSVKEIHRALTAVGERENRLRRERIYLIRDIICFVLMEDDAYRFRFQWLVGIFNPSSWWFRLFVRNPITYFEIALNELEHAEIIGDMKDRIRLYRRITLLILEDEEIRDIFLKLCKEMDWSKLKLSEADKYHFRGKYFKVDFDKFEY